MFFSMLFGQASIKKQCPRAKMMGMKVYPKYILNREENELGQDMFKNFVSRQQQKYNLGDF